MYTDLIIHAANLINYAGFIPPNYAEQIRRGELSAVATYDGNVSEDKMVGISVTGSHAGWLEIVWIVPGPLCREEVDAADFLRYVMRRAEKTGNYIGAFSEIHADEHTSAHRNILLLSGMELREEKNNLYEITVGELKENDAFLRAAKLFTCVFLEDASDELLTAAEDTMLDDARPVPVPPYIDWDTYIDGLSVICTSDGQTEGVMLLTEEKDYLVLNLAYSKSVKALPAMIATVQKRAAELYDPEKKILLPIVGSHAEQLVRKLVPSARRGTIIQAVTWFEPYEAPKSLQLLMSQMTE